MLNNQISHKISTLATDLAVAVSLKDAEAWKELSELCASITEELAAETEFILSDIVNRAEAIFNQLASNKIVNHDTAISHLTQLINFLCNVADSPTYDQAEARELVAGADLYLNDLEDALNSPQENSSPEIDEEFIQEIEGRIDSLESLLFAMMQSKKNNKEDNKTVFREFHTLKGEAGILGLTVLSDFWHSVEDEIQDARTGGLSFNRKAIDLLLQMVKLGRELLIKNSFDQQQKKETTQTLEKLAIAVGNAAPTGDVDKSRSIVEEELSYEEYGNEDTTDFFATAFKSKELDTFIEQDDTGDLSILEELEKNATEELLNQEHIAIEERVPVPAAEKDSHTSSTKEKAEDEEPVEQDEEEHDDFFSMEPEDGYADFSDEEGDIADIANKLQKITPREYDLPEINENDLNITDTDDETAMLLGMDIDTLEAAERSEKAETDKLLVEEPTKTTSAGDEGQSFQPAPETIEEIIQQAETVKNSPQSTAEQPLEKDNIKKNKQEPLTQPEIAKTKRNTENTQEQQATKKAPNQQKDPIQTRKTEEKTQEEELTDETNESVEPDLPIEKPVDSYSLRQVQIDVKKLDGLLDIVSEVSLIGSHLANNPTLMNIASVSSDLQELQRFCRNLNDMASSFRMTAIAPLFKRIQRAAGDTARAIRKQVDLIIEGQDTQVDRIVIERLSAALIHLIRNSVGHGIESADTRRSLNKDPVGKIKLSAKQAGADIVIELSDDGKGLDIDKIKKKAIAAGLINEGDNVKDGYIARLIFSSGFSTTDEVNGISGRGVGMSIVQESIDSLRGRIEVDNRPGKGVTFKLRFPVALAAIEALLVTLDNNILAIPIQSIRETFKLSADDISTIEGRGRVVNVRGIMVPVIKMADFLELNIPEKDSEDKNDGVLVIIDEGDKLAAVLVDEVMETRQVVIRPLEGKLRDIPEITGAALLSDRQISLVLDTRRLIEKTFISSGKAYSDAGAVQVANERKVETIAIGSNAVGIIDFSIDYRKKDGTIKSNTFAINAFKTREFVPATNLTIVPDMPEGFAGMLLLRDDTIPVMALDNLLGLPKAPTDETFYNIIIVCEFSGVTVGFLVTEVNSVSYISWDDINPPPHGGPLIAMKHVIGTILLSVINNQSDIYKNTANDDDIAFLLDFEQIVQQVINLYENIDDSLADITLKKDITTILLAEDSPLIRRETSKALENAGIQVIQAGNGLEAQHIIEQLMKKAKDEGKSIFNYLDLILSDIEMPQMDGYSLTLFCKNHPELRLLPVLLHSSLTNDTIVKRAKEVHADGFIPKCAPAKLAEHLNKYL